MSVLSFFWKLRWALAGIAYFGILLIISVKLNVNHTASVNNFYSIAWSYVTIVVAIISLLYPMALTIRESLTARLFEAHRKHMEIKGNKYSEEDKNDFIKYSYDPVQKFRKILFDQQLPLLASFSIVSVSRVLFCIINIGPYSSEQQIIEPQIYLIGYILWAGWAVISVVRLKPFYAIEIIEAKISDLPVFEISYAQELLERQARERKSPGKIKRDAKTGRFISVEEAKKGKKSQ